MSLRCDQCGCALHEWEMPFSLCDDCHANPEPTDDDDSDDASSYNANDGTEGKTEMTTPTPPPADELSKLREFHACYYIYGGLPHQIPPGKEVAEKWIAAATPPAAPAEELIAKLRSIARRFNWAIGVHGSLVRDIDLIAVPWTAEASDWTAVYDAWLAELPLRDTEGTNRDRPPHRPHNRKSMLILQATSERVNDGNPKGTWSPPCLDVSFMVPRQPMSAQIADSYEKRLREKDADIAKFQDEVRDLLLSLLTTAGLEGTDIDGGGCDSGDWRDFTMSEIRQGFNGLADYYHDRNEEQTKEIADLRAEVERLRGEREASRNRQERDVRDMHAAYADRDRLAAELARAREVVRAAIALRDRLAVVHADPAYSGVWVHYHAHCGNYNGPQYVAELNLLNDAIDALSPTADPCTHSSGFRLMGCAGPSGFQTTHKECRDCGLWVDMDEKCPPADRSGGTPGLGPVSDSMSTETR